MWKLLVDKRDGKGSDVIPPLKLWNLLSGARDTSRYTCLLIQIKYTCVCNYIYIYTVILQQIRYGFFEHIPIG